MLSLTASRGKGASQASEIMNHGGRKGGPQGIQHRQNVDDFLADGAAHWLKYPVAAKAMPITLSAMPPTAL